MTDTMTKDEGVRLVFRWWVIIIVALTGIACLVVPFLYEPFGSWQVITSSTLTNIGTTMTFAAVLFLVERAFVRRVAVQARREAQQVVTTATADLRAENRDLAAKLSDLNDLLKGSDVRRERSREQAVEAFEENVSFHTLTRLMETANDLNALNNGRIVVPAGNDIQSPRISFFWGTSHSASSNVFEEPALELLLRGDGGSVVRLKWSAEMAIVEAAREFDRTVRVAGLIAEADAIDFQTLLTNLRDAVDTAIAGRSSSAAWPDGRIWEWIADGWVITDKGVEVRGYGIPLPITNFPTREVMGARKIPGTGYERPEWADESRWDFATKLVKKHHSQRSGGPSMGYGPYPFTSQNSPLHRD